jgi:hypothetical protein
MDSSHINPHCPFTTTAFHQTASETLRYPRNITTTLLSCHSTSPHLLLMSLFRLIEK